VPVVTPEVRGLTLALFLSIVGVAADAVLKVASAREHPLLTGWFALGCALTGVFAIGWVFLMQTMKIATAGVVYAVASALLLVLIGMVFFEERLSASEITGVAMALGAVVLLGRLTG
jgi:drug/metabolite transporter (DMT)-like permease